jgi:hypothetical protein
MFDVENKKAHGAGRRQQREQSVLVQGVLFGRAIRGICWLYGGSLYQCGQHNNVNEISDNDCRLFTI